jgi:quinol-cytochrome oxidoreductase complex cytochrome b subunit
MGDPVREKPIRTVWFVLFFTYFLVIAVPSAHAYIDPGTGSFVFQVIVGGLLAAGVVFRSFWRRVWSFLSRRNSGNKAS